VSVQTECLVDNILYTFSDETIYQFCFQLKKILPCFCYYEQLSIAGNCRICLVEANNSLVLACSTPMVRGIQVFTNTKRVKYARENVLEFLLLNHPLDCPICDQAGECDLQDISLIFGSDKGRFNDF
jgi:NADH dehydrogenase/NADH:ubiquinone oxidoreductase subunit G